MKINQAEYVTSGVKFAQYPQDGLPEFAFVGRSNVGKSSLINCLVNQRGLARASAEPGKTRTINFFKINNKFYFVDLPGYGFARVSKEQRGKWGEFIEEYLIKRQELKCLCQLVDLRHPPTNDDLNLYWWLRKQKIPNLLIATKADKISRGNWAVQLKQIRDTLEIEETIPVILFSAKTKQGRDEILQQLAGFMR